MKRHTNRSASILLSILVGTLFVSRCWAQSGVETIPFESRSRLPQEYRVGIGDVLEIYVFGFEQFHKSLRVGGEGTIRLPLLEEVAVAGLTTSEIEGRLTRLLKQAELFKSPDVNVRVQEFRSQTVFVMGSVRLPGQYHLTQPSRLIDVLSLAGGVEAERADGSVIIERHRAPEGDPLPDGMIDDGANKMAETILVDLEQLLEAGDLSLNYWIREGDVVSVPERPIREFFIIGEVIRPGAFEIEPEEGLLFSQALARAGGPMKTAKLNKAILARFGADGAREELPINVDKILKGKAVDVPIMEDDVIFIPGSTIKSIAYGLIGAIPRTVSETIVTGRYR